MGNYNIIKWNHWSRFIPTCKIQMCCRFIGKTNATSVSVCLLRGNCINSNLEMSLFFPIFSSLICSALHNSTAMGMKHERRILWLNPCWLPERSILKQKCRLRAAVNQCAMCFFAYLRHIGDCRNLKANLECPPDPEDGEHLKEPLVLYLQR